MRFTIKGSTFMGFKDLHYLLGLPYFEKQKSGHWMTNFHETKFMAPPTFSLSKVGR